MTDPAAIEGFTRSDEVDRIAAMSDPVLRNLRITQCYHELSRDLAARTGGSANWCSFATWASKQAGSTIRREDLARALDRSLTENPLIAQAAAEVAAVARRIGARREADEVFRFVLGALHAESAIERAAAAVGRGNRKVFAEIGREFARFAETCMGDAAYDEANIARFCEGLREGDPPDGQSRLRMAFGLYYRCCFDSGREGMAERMLLANLEIGFHEQTRLQPEIAEALDASLAEPAQFARNLVRAVFPWRGLPFIILLFLKRVLGIPSPLDAAVEKLLDIARRQLREFLTRQMMELGFPRGERLRLGDDLHAAFPASLQRLSETDLLALLKRIDPTPDSTRATGAKDWADLAERLHFIADLFRCYQEAPELREAPFSAHQTSAIIEGRVPDGTL